MVCWRPFGAGCSAGRWPNICASARNCTTTCMELAHTKADSCAKLMRSRRFSRGVITKERLEGGLNVLVDTNELRAVEVLNKANETVAAAGARIDLPPDAEFENAAYWGQGHCHSTISDRFGHQLGGRIGAAVQRIAVHDGPTSLAAESNSPPAAVALDLHQPRPPPRPDLTQGAALLDDRGGLQNAIISKSAHTFVLEMNSRTGSQGRRRATSGCA